MMEVRQDTPRRASVMSRQLLDEQDIRNAVDFMSRAIPGFDANVTNPEVFLKAIGNLMRENRMLVNLVKSLESSENEHKLPTDGNNPPFTETPQYSLHLDLDELIPRYSGNGSETKNGQPCEGKQDGNTGFRLTPNAVIIPRRRYCGKGYSKPNAGIMK